MNSMRMPLLLAIVVGGLGIPVTLYYLIWSPLTDLQQREEALGVILSKELKENGDHLKTRKEILKAHPRLEDWKVLSWPEPKTKPADRHINDLQAEYRISLEDIVEDSGLDDWNVDLSKSTLSANASTLKKGGKKDQWQSATYRITGNGSLEQIGKVLEGVYKMPTLHRVANLTIKRDDNDKKNLTKDKLELILNIEALAMVGAEKRDALLPTLKAPKYPLVNKNRKHSALLAKANPFVLPSPPAPTKPEVTAPPVVKEEKPKEDREEYLTGVRFTSLSSYERGSKTGWMAQFYDQNNNGDKKIYSLGLRRDLGFQDMYGNDVLTGEMVFANERMVVLLIEGAYFRFYVGDDLYPDESRMLSPEEYKALGLKPPPKPEPKKPVAEEEDS